jgi:hypothetical protein
MSKIGQCKMCLFWALPEPGYGPEGKCHRYAPKPFVDTRLNGTGLWPYTKGNEFCGEWAPKTSE